MLGRDYDVIFTMGGTLLRTHGPVNCADEEVCCIHRPSAHHMATWPQVWRSDRRLMERVCQHGVGHPDPDDLSIRRGVNGAGVHGCDGCCLRKGERTL